MSFLSKLFGGGKTQPSEQPVITRECPHAALVPKWGNVQDMGIEAKATSFECDACHKMFTPEEARISGEGLADRIKLPASGE